MGRLLSFWNRYIRRCQRFRASLLPPPRRHRRMDISNLKSEINKYQQQYDEESARLQSLMNNPEAVEKLAREKYLMKRADEDVFVIVDSASTDNN